jgi:hypothetical protein
MHMDTIPEAVADALNKRKEKEKLFTEGGPGLYAAEAPEIQAAATEGELKRRATIEKTSSSGDEAKRRHARAKSADATAIFQANTGQKQQNKQPQSQVQQRPVSVLPPSSPLPKRSHSPARPSSPYTPEPRVYTFEELSSRHREKMREMQRPLSEQEQDQVRLDAAKNRWARANKNEKVVMGRKEAEARASLEAKRKDKEKRAPAGEFGEHGQRSGGESSRSRQPQNSRSPSTDKQTGVTPLSQRRSSMMKVQEWQKYQQRTVSSPEPDSDVPFPSDVKKQRRTSRGMSGMKQHPT